MAWNPRYVAYASAHGQTPEDMIQRDREKYPGGSMCGFILWISDMYNKFFKEHPEHFFTSENGKRPIAIMDQDAWTKFLQEQARNNERVTPV